MESVPPERTDIRGPEPGVKICGVCGDRLPATRFYFHVDKDADDGFYGKCKQCRRKDRMEQENRQIATAIAGGERKLLSMLKSGEFREVLCDVVSGSEIVLKAFGGIEGLAQKLAMDYDASPVGTPSRTKLLLGVLGFVAKGMEAQQPVEVSNLTDEQLRQRLMEALGDGNGRRIADQPEANPPVGGSESV